MARPVSPEKIKNIKSSVVKLIAQKGYSGTTVADVANHAKVSDGYLYRFYENKEALVQSVYEVEVKAFHDFIEQSIVESSTARAVIDDIVTYLFSLALNNTDLYRFIHVMLHDPTFVFPRARLETIRDLSERIVTKGKQTGEFDLQWCGEDLFVLIFSVPFKFLDSRLRGTYKRGKLTEKDRTQLIELLFRALSKK